MLTNLPGQASLFTKYFPFSVTGFPSLSLNGIKWSKYLIFSKFKYLVFPYENSPQEVFHCVGVVDQFSTWVHTAPFSSVVSVRLVVNASVHLERELAQILVVVKVLAVLLAPKLGVFCFGDIIFIYNFGTNSACTSFNGFLDWSFAAEVTRVAGIRWFWSKNDTFFLRKPVNFIILQ